MRMSVKEYKEQGQVLIFAVVILIILLVATIFLFDLHSIIRSKIKLDTAEQSAALAAAKWQARSLNLIGDINYVKALDTLLLDIPIVSDENTDDNTAEIASAIRTLTEMQSRISFCGPLIALGAAQQAAKNNGINIADPYTQTGNKTVYSDMLNYLMKLDSSSPYYNYNDIEEYIGGYKWREPYVAMLQLIKDQGLAVRPNGRFPGIESIDPPWLDDESLYKAILNKTWCNPTLNSVIKYPDSYWNGKWYNVDFEHTSFPDESEIYTLGIRFTNSVDQATRNTALSGNPYGDNASDEELVPISWCTYDSKWSRYNADGITENLNYSGPNNSGTGVNYWRAGMFLRDDLKPAMYYGGATAYAECYQYIPVMSKFKSKMERPLGEDHAYAGSDQMEKAAEALRNDIIKEEARPAQKVGNDSSAGDGNAGAVAKPLGTLPDGSPPSDAILVLPIFTDVALIPSTMQGCRPLRVDFSALEKFLIWLSGVEDLQSPNSSPPEGTQMYLTALQTLNSETFRKSGWNNDYVYNGADASIFFDDGYKYAPENNPTGAGWLQQIWMSTDSSREDDESTELEEEEAGWNTRIYSGKKYILRNRNGNLVTNEQMQCRWTPGGPGNVHVGTRIGPPRL